jgi:hypothetical protein
MSAHYKKYVWKNGIPYGVSAIDVSSQEEETYKIIADPYRKRISIEKYLGGTFSNLIYDSYLLDFRHLKKPELTAWQVTSREETHESFIRNQDDRLVFIETYHFQDHLCRGCLVKSPHGILLSTHKMYYHHLGDSFNGVVLFDANEVPVMKKEYEFDSEQQEFTTLIAEQWEVEWQKSPL